MDIFNWINSLNSGASLAVVGYIGYICRQVPEKIWDLIDQNFSITIQATNDSSVLYNRTCGWLMLHCPKLKNHIFDNAFLGTDDDNNNIVEQITIADGYYNYMLDWATWISIHKTKILNHGSEDTKFDIFVKIVGLNREKYLKEYKTFIHTDEERNVLYADIKGNRFNTISIYKKSFNDIYLDIIPDLKKIIDKFRENEHIYKQHGITHKLGLCFYGPGGVGKSILCRAIATYLNWDLTIIKNCGSSTSFDSDGLQHNVVVLEELDLYCALNREKDYEEDVDPFEAKLLNVTPNKSIMLQNLLTFLDGIESPNHCVIVATTNYIDRIDPILLRPGRFDYKFELTYMDKSKAIKMCNNFDVPVEDIITEDIEFPCSPAVVQNKILHYISESK